MDTYQNTPSFICFPSLDATAPAPLASTHCRLAVRDAVWHNWPSVASTGPLFRRSKIVTFVTMASRSNGRWHCAIKMCRNDRICNRIQLLAVSYLCGGRGRRWGFPVIGVRLVILHHLSFEDLLFSGGHLQIRCQRHFRLRCCRHFRLLPHIFPHMVTPTMFLVDKKW